MLKYLFLHEIVVYLQRVFLLPLHRRNTEAVSVNGG